MNQKQKQQLTVLGIVVVTAIIAVLVIIVAAKGQSNAANVDFNEILQTRLSDGGHVLGDPDAPITIVEFADYLCSHCQTYKSTINEMIELFVVTGKAKFEYRMLPTQAASQNLFRLTECMANTGKASFWEIQDTFFDLAASTSVDNIGREAAKKFDISYAEMLTCADALTRSGNAQFVADTNLARAFSITGTPTVRVRYGDSSQLEALINGAPTIDILRDVIEGANLLPVQ